MNIGEVAAASGVSAKMVRHYESLGVIRRADRSRSGYRHYGQVDVEMLRFVQRTRAAGFPLAQVKALVALWLDRGRPAREVKRLAATHLAGIELRIAGLREVAATLSHLVEHCHGSERPDCPILEAFATPSPADRTRHRGTKEGAGDGSARGKRRPVDGSRVRRASG